jgi:cell division protein FtsL
MYDKVLSNEIHIYLYIVMIVIAIGDIKACVHKPRLIIIHTEIVRIVFIVSQEAPCRTYRVNT